MQLEDVQLVSREGWGEMQGSSLAGASQSWTWQNWACARWGGVRCLDLDVKVTWGNDNVWIKKKWHIQSDNQRSLNSLALARFQTLSNPQSGLGAGGWWLERFAGSRQSGIVREWLRAIAWNRICFQAVFHVPATAWSTAFRARSGMHKASVNITKSSARLISPIYILTNREWAQSITTFAPDLKINSLMSLFLAKAWPRKKKWFFVFVCCWVTVTSKCKLYIIASHKVSVSVFLIHYATNFALYNNLYKF